MGELLPPERQQLPAALPAEEEEEAEARERQRMGAGPPWAPSGVPPLLLPRKKRAAQGRKRASCR